MLAVGWTPLHEACNTGSVSVAERLLRSGANVNAQGLDEETALHDAASNNHVEVCYVFVVSTGGCHQLICPSYDGIILVTLIVL